MTFPASRRAIGATTLALALVLSLAGCGGSAPASDDAALEAQVYTHTSGGSELFVEFAPLVSGEKSTFAAHFTRLSDYRPVTEGVVDVVLSGGGAPEERFRVRAPRAPGIFAPTVQPRAVGERQLSLVLRADGVDARHDLGSVLVHADRAAAALTGPAPGHVDGEIAFLKEQQWVTDFGIEAVQPAPLRDSVAAPATLRASADGSAELVAVSDGLIRASGPLPALGQAVTRGQTLAFLVPRLGGDTDLAALRADDATATSAAALADNEAARMQRLFDQQAVSLRRLEEALAAQQQAAARRKAAKDRLDGIGGEATGIALKAPISGVIALASVANGAAVDAGDRLFQIVDRREIWIEAHVAEADAPRLRTPDGIAFALPGLDTPIEVRHGDNGRLVGRGSVIDASTRSVPVIFAMSSPDPRISLHQRVEARVFTGERRLALSVPVTAVIDDAGQRVVYVMRSGESFSRVPVRLGIRDGDRLEVLDGLMAGDRVVSRGAAQVRLAAATPEAMGHGHAH